MSLIPFSLDRSPTAKLIRSIDSAERSVDKLEHLKYIMVRDIDAMPYGYLEQACHRAGSTCSQARDDTERDLLQSIHMMALRRIQRIHIECRP